MAKASMIARESKRARTVQRYSEKRSRLRAILKDPRSADEQKEDARLQLQALPRDASPVRMRNRCGLTGRPHGYYRKFGLARSKLREAMMRGDVPGLVKGSW